ncbi:DEHYDRODOLICHYL DIPHOSPHATE SYNTHASE FAMILY MEMBER [Salix koriyanagi]|uniref:DEHYDRODOLICHYL DIPHOSPHATE SYNTHASE FAMILY MEMBER n=1 Tax=Salix koriyanagi TaxID=2511006 RepID=A0A9Q1AN77_9ROSI|nr:DEHYDRODOLICHYL DIPHOSPHATE SYNTHASE FAMILY MEMBER [Salix koriyanagi]
MLSLRLRRTAVCKTLPQNFFQFFSHQKTSDDRPQGFPPLAAKNLNSGVIEEEIGGIEQAMQLPEGLRRESMPRHVAGIKVVTVFAFSIDNWTRPKEEVDIVMTLIENLLKSGMDDFIREGTRVSIIGDSSRVPESLQRTICEIQEMTRENSKFHFIMAISYSGTYDLVEACKSVAQKSAYSELFFAKALWPDFGKNDFVEALASYQQRQRRYGSRYA